MSAANATSKVKQVFGTLGALSKRNSAKGTCLFDLCYGVADNGVGRRVTRRCWRDPVSTYVTLSRVAVHEAPRSLLKRGTAYGVLTWKGVTEPTERRLTSTSKHDWRWAASEPSVVPARDFALKRAAPRPSAEGAAKI